MKYKRAIKPSVILPADLILGYYEKDPQTLKEVESWLSKNGLTIMFTLQEAYGNESVFLHTDGHIYIGSHKVPSKDWLKKLLLKISPNLLRQAVAEDWSKIKMYEEIKKRSYTP